jgi:hypothetical protein
MAMTPNVYTRSWVAVGLGVLLLAGGGGCALVQELCSEFKPGPCKRCCDCECCQCCGEPSGGQCGNSQPQSAPSKAESHTAPAPLPQPTDAAPLPPTPPKPGAGDDGAPWPGEVPVAPQNTGKSPSDSSSGQPSTDVRVTACLGRPGMVPGASGSSDAESAQPPRLLDGMAACAPPNPPESPVSSGGSDSGAEIRMVIHDDPSSPRPASNPLR